MHLHNRKMVISAQCRFASFSTQLGIVTLLQSAAVYVIHYRPVISAIKQSWFILLHNSKLKSDLYLNGGFIKLCLQVIN